MWPNCQRWAFRNSTAHADVPMKSTTGKQERKARPRIKLEKKSKKCASAETESSRLTSMPRRARITPGAVPSSGFRKSTGKHTTRHINFTESLAYPRINLAHVWGWVGHQSQTPLTNPFAHIWHINLTWGTRGGRKVRFWVASVKMNGCGKRVGNWRGNV